MTSRSSSEPFFSSSPTQDAHDSDPTDVSPVSRNDAYVLAKGHKTTTGKAPTSMSNARQLLDPRSRSTTLSQCSIPPAGSSHSARSLHETAEISNELSVARSDPGFHEQEVGVGNQIERLHGVESRTERPSKRQKLDDNTDTEKKAKFSTMSKGGELGEYVQQKQKEGIQVPNSVVDLTGGMRIAGCLETAGRLTFCR